MNFSDVQPSDPTALVKLISNESTGQALRILQIAIFRLGNASQSELMQHIADVREEYAAGTVPHLRRA